MRRANPKLWFDLVDSAMTTCYHCGQAVCVSCQHVPVDTVLVICDQCYESIPDDDDGNPSRVPALPTRASTNTVIDPGQEPRQANEKWSESEYGQLIEMLRDGLPLEDIAAQLGRGVDAVAGRCQRLLRPGDRVSRSEADLVLRVPRGRSGLQLGHARTPPGRAGSTGIAPLTPSYGTGGTGSSRWPS
jgi:hypothetical protein